MTQAATISVREESWARADLRELYLQHANYVRGLLTRLLCGCGDPDDLLQEVFVIAWQKLERFQGDAVRSWLCGIAVRLAAAARRRAWVRGMLGIQNRVEEADWRTPDRAVEQDEASRAVYAILDRLSEKKRTVFILYEIQGLSASEIAAALDCPVKTVWSRLEHARREFLEHLEAEEKAGAARRGGAIR